MSVLTRDVLEDGSYANKLGLPADLVWSPEQLDESLASTLADRPAGDIWVFAYGSLMWNPLLHFNARENAVLEGWHRSFCLKSVAGRGSVGTPGRMLALEPGGIVAGIALRLAGETAYRELRILWAREMASGSYIPRWEQVTLADGHLVSALVFVANKSHPLYDRNTSAGQVAPFIVHAAGKFGTNAEYVCHLNFALADAGLEDPYVDALVHELKGASAAVMYG